MFHLSCSLHLCVCEVFLQVLIGSQQMLILLLELCLLPIPGGDPMERCNIKLWRKGWNPLHVQDVQYNMWLTPCELWEQHFFWKTKVNFFFESNSDWSKHSMNMSLASSRDLLCFTPNGCQSDDGKLSLCWGFSRWRTNSFYIVFHSKFWLVLPMW